MTESIQGKNRIRYSWDKLVSWTKTFSFPGMQGVSIYYVIVFFIRGFQKGTLVTRASSIAFNILIGILPALIFIFTLIPFVPISNFQNEMLLFLENILPKNAFMMIEGTIVEVITKKSRGLLFFMFLTTVLISTNGIHALLHAFNISSHEFETRSWVSQRRASLFLLFIITMMLAGAILIILIGKSTINKLVEIEVIQTNVTYYLLIAAKWITLLVLVFFIISSVYYQIPARKKEWRFFSPGSIVATFLFVVSSLGFSSYVNNFGQYNKLYGSIGTLMVILLWIYFNSISLLIGFELNASIKTANTKKELLERRKA
ncbi:MAG: YihY/virulence factor BrkB family protein [Bacteroidota bacterium]|nr:YihY/virulence factor BrkB family protein [Bacteroidota bacterium]